MIKEKRHMTRLGLWWKASKYEIRDGYIRPARRSSGAFYDPWKEAETGRGGRPYMELASLARLSPYKSEGEHAVLAWVERFGLLGILLHEVLFVRFAPQQMPTLTRGRKVRLQIACAPTIQGWMQFTSATDLSPEVFLRPFRSINVVRETLSGRWAKFFPDVSSGEADTFDYPAPGSMEFFRLYAEPVSEFIEAAGYLRHAVLGLADPDGKESTSEDNEVSGGESGVRALEDLIAPARPSLTRPGEALAFRSPSLLGTIATVAAIEQTDRRHPWKRCRNCGEPFRALHPKAISCSERCSSTARRREWYHSKKMKEEEKAPRKARRSSRRPQQKGNK